MRRTQGRKNAAQGDARDESAAGSSGGSRISRRDIMKYSAGGAALAWGGALLAACSSGSSSSSSSASSGGATTSGAATPSSTGSASAAPTAGGTLTAEEKQTLLAIAGPTNKSFLGGGTTWKIGAAFPFSGPYQYYETIEADGLLLATQHITQLGGPKIELNLQNFGGSSGVNTQLAVDDMLNFHDAGNGLSVSGIQAALGALIPGAEQYKILNIDAGAGVGVFAGKDYYWAMRADYPMNNVTVALEHAKIATPTARSAIVVYDSGAAYAPVLNACVAAAKAAGYTVTGTATQPNGTTDWSDTYATIRSQNPDIILLVINGNDCAYFLKQFSTTGLKQPTYTFSYSAPQQTLAGSGFEGIYVVQEDFLPNLPSNDWQSIFTKYYRQEFASQGTGPSSPFNISANYYNVGYVLWELASRVLAKGGNINDGTQLQAALQADPTFPSIFGGSGTTAGKISFDLTSHGLASCPLAIVQIKNQQPVYVGTADAEGSSGAGPLTLAS
jgi:branched-chain amino acid transport system substrate-binding protein